MGKETRGRLKRGDLARLGGVNPETIRFYEREGIPPTPDRTAHNYRLYGEDDVRRVRFIKRAQNLGFSLDEVRELLSLRTKKSAPCVDVESRARAKISDIAEKVRQLEAMKTALAALVEQCGSSASSSDCPILDSLEQEDEGALS